jgi:hypothetical protein
MKQARIISRVFFVSAIVLLCAMCSVVSYQYGVLLAAGKQLLTSAPPWVAFYLAIPFAVGIAACACLSVFFGKKAK